MPAGKGRHLDNTCSHTCDASRERTSLRIIHVHKTGDASRKGTSLRIIHVHKTGDASREGSSLKIIHIHKTGAVRQNELCQQGKNVTQSS